MVVAYRLPFYPALDFLAIQLSMLGSLFLAYAIIDGRWITFATEMLIAAGMLACTLLGMWKWAWLIPTGFVVVGIWALLHHLPLFGAKVQYWFANLCAAYAWLMAGFIFLRFIH